MVIPPLVSFLSSPNPSLPAYAICLCMILKNIGPRLLHSSYRFYDNITAKYHILSLNSSIYVIISGCYLSSSQNKQTLLFISPNKQTNEL